MAARWGQDGGLTPVRPAPPRSALETRVQALETKQQAELASLRGEKERLQRLLSRQNGALAGLERSLRAASSNSSLLQHQQNQLLESVQRLVRVAAQDPGERGTPGAEEGRSGWAHSLLTLPVHSQAWKPPRGRRTPLPPPVKEITTNNNIGDNTPNRNQSRLLPDSLGNLGHAPFPLLSSVSPSV